MPVDIQDGPLGLEARHIWRGLLTLNDLTAIPRYRFTAIRGLHAAPEFDTPTQPAGSIIGEFPFLGVPRGKTVVYEGLIEAQTIAEVRQMANRMRSLFSDPRQQYQMLIQPHPDYGTVSWFYNARCTGLDLDDEAPSSVNRNPTKEVRSFTLTLRMSDPRFYLDGDVVDSGAHTSEFDTTNTGDAPTDPVLVMDIDAIPAGVNIALYNDTHSRKLQVFTIEDIAAGTIVWDFTTRSIAYYEGSSTVPSYSVISALDQYQSNWWDKGVYGLLPDVNHIRWATDPTGSYINSVQALYRVATF